MNSELSLSAWTVAWRAVVVLGFGLLVASHLLGNGY